MPGLISVLQLPLLTKKPSTVDEGFVKYYFFEGNLRVLADIDHDVVLDRTLQGLSDVECSPVITEDTVITAFSKIKACIQAINDSKLILGETETTAYRGDRGKTAYDHSQEEHQVILSGIGFVKVNGEDLSFDDTEYVIANGLIDPGIGIKLNYDSKGLITGVSDLLASDIPALAYRPDTWEPDLSEYVITIDSRLSDARNANDVYDWAKNVTKPEYTYSEIDGTPTLLSQFENDPGYLTEETDPIFVASPAFGISSASILSWTNKVSFPGFGLTHDLAAYGDHDHSLIYAPIIHSHIITDVIGLGTALGNKLEISLKGAVNGLAELDASGFVKNTQLPSYVDDVLDGTWVSTTTFNNLLGAAYSPESGKIYIDTTTNKTYRWSGTVYAIVSDSLALGILSSTAYRGDFGDIAYINRITSLTTVGTGVASLSGNVLNIPTYASTDTLATVTGRGNTTATAIYITDTTQSDLYNQGSIKTAGGIGAIKNIYAGGVVYGAGFMATHSSVPYYGFGPLGDKASLNFDISQGKLIFKVGASEVIKFNTTTVNIAGTLAVSSNITGTSFNLITGLGTSGSATSVSRNDHVHTGTYIQNQLVSPQSASLWISGPAEFEGDVTVKSLLFDNSYLIAPFLVNSTVKVINLNVDLLDGQHGSYYATASGYLPLTGGVVTGYTSFNAAPGVSSLDVGTLNNDTSSTYGFNAVGGDALDNRKIFRVGIYLASNGFTVDWLYAPSRFVYNFNMGDITVDGNISATSFKIPGGTSTQALMADGSLGTLPVVSSGSYTPNAIDIANTSAHWIESASYIRVGNIVHCQVDGTVVASSANTDTSLAIDLPFVSTVSQTGVLLGVGSLININNSNPNPSVSVSRTSGYALMYFTYKSTSAGDQVSFSIQFDYSL